MYSQEEILLNIKTAVLEEIPGARVYLFGSRATGNIHEESDWDILVLTERISDRALRKRIHYKLFPLGLKINGFIGTTIVNEEEWLENPSYYALRLSIKDEQVSK
ncbi:MAG: nucleotidyltransferase domain-containing protein [Ginsengibacter sp.]